MRIFNRKLLMALGFGLWALGFGLWVPDAKADEGYQLRSFYSGISTIAVDARFNLPESGNPSLRTRMADILINSKILSRDNIKNIAKTYILKNLKKKLPVITWNPNSSAAVWDSTTFIIRFDYSVWEQEVYDKKVVILSMAEHMLRPLQSNPSLLLTNNDTLEVSSFIVDKNEQATQNNLELTVDRMLNKFVHDINGQ